MRSNRDEAAMTPEQYRVLSSCQKVWQRDTFWSFLYLQSKIFNSPNCPEIEDETLDLSEQFGSLLAQYYGYEAGRLFSNNTYKHFDIYIQFIYALKEDNREKASVLLKQWHDNSGLIVNQLCELNSHWRELELRGMFTQEMQILEDSANRNLEGEYQDLGFSFDVYANIAFEIAEYIAVGIIKQFSIK